MRKSLKFIGLLASILVLLLVLAVVCVVTFVNPNRFKPLLTEQVMKYTGRQLTIDGSLSWTLFPYLGVKAGHMLLSNPAGFGATPFAEIEYATVAVRLWPLLHKRIESSGITLDGLKLNLMREPNGKNNWQLQRPISGAAAASVIGSPSTQTMPKMSAGLAVSSISITNAEINWTDKQKKRAGSIDKFSLYAKDISLLKPFSITSEFNFSSHNPVVAGHIALAGQMAMNVAQQVFSCRDLKLTAKLQQGNKKAAWQIMGDVRADLAQQTLEWTHFRSQLENLTLTGKIGVVDWMTSPHATGHLQIQPCDLKKLLETIGQDVSNIEVLQDFDGDIDFTAAANAIDVQGKFKIEHIQIKKLKVSHVIIPLHYQIGVLELSPITADVYQGSLLAAAKINLTGAVAQIATQGKLMNVQAGPLLQDLGGAKQKLTLTGIGNVDWQVTTAGNSTNTWIKNLNGTGHVSFNQGKVQGIDIGYLLDSAYAFAKQKAHTTSNTYQTEFGNLTASVLIRDGVIANDDLLVNSARFNTKGKGNINLVEQKIDFHLQTLVNQTSADQKNDWGNLYGLPIPIFITGSLESPSIRLDTSLLVQAVAAQEIKKIQNQVQGKANKLLQNLLGK
jgi:AsmA protein